MAYHSRAVSCVVAPAPGIRFCGEGLGGAVWWGAPYSSDSRPPPPPPLTRPPAPSPRHRAAPICGRVRDTPRPPPLMPARACARRRASGRCRCPRGGTGRHAAALKGRERTNHTRRHRRRAPATQGQTAAHAWGAPVVCAADDHHNTRGPESGRRWHCPCPSCNTHGARRRTNECCSPDAHGASLGPSDGGAKAHVTTKATLAALQRRLLGHRWHLPFPNRLCGV